MDNGLLERIDARKRELGIDSDAELCRMAGLRVDYLNNVRRGKSPSAKNLAALAIPLRCSVDHLLTGQERPAAPFDAARFLIVVEQLARMLMERQLVLPPQDVAELALHLYHSSESQQVSPPSLSDIIIQWLSGRFRARDA